MEQRSFGLSQVAGSEDAVVDIVFVHGSTGHRESDWTSKNNNFWLKTLLPQSIPNARILTWGYHSFFYSDIHDVDNSTRELGFALTVMRTHEPDRPIILVGHDIGALVCADFISLTRGYRDEDPRGIVDCVRGIIFLGILCPPSEREKSKERRLSHPLARHLVSRKNIQRGFLDHARDASTVLWYPVLRSRGKINTFSFYEEDEDDFFPKGVTKNMATPLDKSYEPLPIPGNHESMCKFESSDEPGYIMIKWVLQKWIRELPEHKSAGLVDPAEPSTVANVPALDTPSELHILHGLLGLSKKDATSTSEDSNGRLKPLLSPQTVRWLASKELLSSIQKDRLTISTAPLLESFTISTTDPSSTEGNWSLSEDGKPFSRKVDIPIRLYSAETYEFLGYNRDVAEHLWSTFNSSLNPSFSLFEVSKQYLKDHLMPPADSNYGWSSWNDVMDNIGIYDSLRNSILDSHFVNIRSTGSCEFWLRTAFEIRWQELQALNEDLLKAMKRTASTGEQPIEPESSALSHDHGTNTQQSQFSQHQDTAQPPSEQGIGEQKEKGPVTGTTPATKTIEPESEQITLWRGGTKTSIEKAIVNKKLDLINIRSRPGDFSGTMGVPYFTTQRETAEQYGAFHTTLSQFCTPPYLLKFQVGKKWLGTLRHQCLWKSGIRNNTCDIGALGCPEQQVQGGTNAENRSWERVVFTCRRGDFTPEFLKQCDLVIGHVARFHTEIIQNMESEAGISGGLLLINDIPAVQYAFVSESSQRELVTEASGVVTECLGGTTRREYRNAPGERTDVGDVRYQPLN